MDPDAPSPDAPKYRFFLHWLVTNIPGVDVKRGDVIEDYMGPVSFPSIVPAAYSLPKRGLKYPALLITFPFPRGNQLALTQAEASSLPHRGMLSYVAGLPEHVLHRCICSAARVLSALLL